MSNVDILKKVYDLRDKIVCSDLYVELRQKEKKMLEDDDCYRLLCLYQDAQGKYNEAKRFENYGGNVDLASKELSNMKVRVEENMLVKEYNEYYKKMKNELKRIEKILFKDIIKERKEIELE